MKVKATPTLHQNHEVTLQLEFEIRALSGNNINGIPIISNRTLSQVVRVRDDETIVDQRIARQGRDAITQRVARDRQRAGAELRREHAQQFTDRHGVYDFGYAAPAALTREPGAQHSSRDAAIRKVAARLARARRRNRSRLRHRHSRSSSNHNNSRNNSQGNNRRPKGSNRNNSRRPHRRDSSHRRHNRN